MQNQELSRQKGPALLATSKIFPSPARMVREEKSSAANFSFCIGFATPARGELKKCRGNVALEGWQQILRTRISDHG